MGTFERVAFAAGEDLNDIARGPGGSLYVSGLKIWASSDEGKTFESVPTEAGYHFWQLAAVQGGGPVYAVASSTSGGHVLRSDDGSAFRELVCRKRTELRTIVALGDVVIAAGDKEVIRSTNGGRSWKRVIAVPALDLFVLEPDQVFMVDGRTLMHSNDQGATWQKLEPAVGAYYTRGVASGGTAYFCAFDCLTATADQGASWKLILGSRHNIRADAVAALPDGQVAVVSPSKLLVTRSSDGGLVEEEIDARPTTGIPLADRKRLRRARLFDRALWVVGEDGEIYRKAYGTNAADAPAQATPLPTPPKEDEQKSKSEPRATEPKQKAEVPPKPAKGRASTRVRRS